MSNEEELRLTDLVDIDTLQRMQDAFSKLTGIASLTTDIDGVPVTNGSKFSDFCMCHTRQSPTGASRCEKCDKYGAELALKEGRSVTYFCHAGLKDFAAPIMAHDKMLGCFIGGQVLTEPPDDEQMRKIAEDIGVDPQEYIEAAHNVNIVSEDKIDDAAEFLYTIASILSDIAYGRYLVYQANIETERAANMKSDFLANMSHEIRTPMNAVIGMADMALREELPPDAREYIQQIKASGRSLLTIINDILDFSKIESGKMSILPVEYEPMSIVNDVTNIIMSRIADKDVEFILDVNPNIPHRIYGDNNRIKQIILNLANNAVKFTKKGEVVLHIGFEYTAEDEILLKVIVEDTGIGIKKENLSKLFQSFQQLDSKRNRNIEGTGLGLAISRKLLYLMNGSIHVESEYEKGSTFSFELPQKVIDKAPSIVIRNSEAIFTAGLIANKYVRRQLEISVKRLNVAYTELSNIDELKLMCNNGGITHLIVESALWSKEVEQFISNKPELTVILVTSLNESLIVKAGNVRIIKKPVYSLNLAMIFNDEKIQFEDDSDNDVFDFIAPEAEVLVVDDNIINITVAEGLLEPLKMKIDTALSGREAVEKISAKRYDIVFMDHMMPDMDGVETTHVIRRFHPEYNNMPIIALTANAIDGTAEMFLKEGMNDFVAKPIELKVLVSKVKRWLPAGMIQIIDVKNGNNADDSNNPLPVIGDLDINSAFRLLGNEKLFWSVLKDYYRAIDSKSQLIEGYEREEDWPSYTIEVHALKSASRQIGANSLADMAFMLEQAGNDKNAAVIHDNTAKLLKQYRGYTDVLAPFFDDEEEVNKVKQLITVSELKQFFRMLENAIEELDADGMEEVAEGMKKYSYRSIQQELFTKLQKAIANIDVEACEEIIRQWLDIINE